MVYGEMFVWSMTKMNLSSTMITKIVDGAHELTFTVKRFK